MEKEFDITVIGSEPGGYVAAIRAAQLGYQVALIEKYTVLGGTCTNVGCIPSKALLDSSEHFYNAKAHFPEQGVEAENLSLNFSQFIKRQDQVVIAPNNSSTITRKPLIQGNATVSVKYPIVPVKPKPPNQPSSF